MVQNGWRMVNDGRKVVKDFPTKVQDSFIKVYTWQSKKRYYRYRSGPVGLWEYKQGLKVACNALGKVKNGL